MDPRLTATLLVFLSGSLVLTGCTVPAASLGPRSESQAGAQACLYTDRILNFRTEGRRLYVRAQGDDVFAFTETGCLDLEGTYAVSIRPTFGGSNRLCPGEDAEIGLPSGAFGPNPCRARLDRRLTEAEVEALPTRNRP